MKRIIFALLIVIIAAPVFAKAKPIKHDIQIGMTQVEVKQAIGKPAVVAADYEGIETWIYENTVLPASRCSNFGNIYNDKNNTTVVIKFDSNQKISEFSYQKNEY